MKSRDYKIKDLALQHIVQGDWLPSVATYLQIEIERLGGEVCYVGKEVFSSPTTKTLRLLNRST